MSNRPASFASDAKPSMTSPTTHVVPADHFTESLSRSTSGRPLSRSSAPSMAAQRALRTSMYESAAARAPVTPAPGLEQEQATLPVQKILAEEETFAQPESSTDLAKKPASQNINLDRLNDVDRVSIQAHKLTVTVNTNASITHPATWPSYFIQARRKRHQHTIDPETGAQITGPNTASRASSSCSVSPGSHQSTVAGGATADGKILLHPTSHTFRAGTLTAIFGGSGAGKTTLLNTLAGRLTSSSSSHINICGKLLLTNHTSGLAGKTAYVAQQDVLLPSLTVRETLSYAAALRLGNTTSQQQEHLVDDVIQELGLKHCAHTRIGDGHLRRGISGGEKRRVSIGVQLLANPSVIFLDEPTTGLDATSAFRVISTLKSLVLKGRTVIVSIHQPRSEIWHLFDDVVILGRGGNTVYAGDRSKCVPWFESLMDTQMGEFVNPAEWVVDCVAVDLRTAETEKESSARMRRFSEAWRLESRRLHGDEDEKKPAQNGSNWSYHRVNQVCLKGAATATISNTRNQAKVSFVCQVRVLTARAFKVTYRDPMGMTASIFEAVIMAIVTGYIFFDLSRSLSGIRSRQGALYTAVSLQGYLFLLYEVYRLTLDMPVFDRERSEGYVSAGAYMLSRRFARFFIEDLPVPFIFSAIFYFMANLNRTWPQILIFFAINVLNHFLSVTSAMACVALSRNFAYASLLANLIYTLLSLASGNFIQIDSIPIYVRWLKWLAWSFYTFSALCTNEFKDAFYDCPAVPSTPDNPACRPYTGAFILQALGFPKNWIWRPIVILTAFVMFFLLSTFLTLTFMKVNLTVAKSKKHQPQTDTTAGKQSIVDGTKSVRPIDMSIHDYSLILEKRVGWRHRLIKKEIVAPTTSIFRAGELNAIIGPSGSGKTSLLNAVAGRLLNTPGTTYQRSGIIKFNNAVPSDAVVKSVVSFVAQEDVGLLPSLTVRETLRYAALLRLPSNMTTLQKLARAEEVLRRLGLSDCAENVIGSEWKKGISGGEKRRVSIAVQILTDPMILLLDEPTSGLDAFTAASIMEVLQGLAKEGRTIILTIHQARCDLWKHFGNVLLFARGGRAVYSGRCREMMDWFASHGHHCPINTNPADFALDLVTVDLRRDDLATESEKRVQGLVSVWQQQMTIKMSHDCGPGSADTEGEQGNGRQAAHHSYIPPPRQSFGQASLLMPAELGALVRKPAPFLRALPVLLSRSWINLRRQPDLILSRTAQVVGVGALFTLFVAPLKHNFESIQNRLGFIQQVGAFYAVGMLQNMGSYPAERDVAYAESMDGVYGPSLFLLVYTILELPMESVAAGVFAVLAVFGAGTRANDMPLHLIKMWGFVSVCTLSIVSCGESIGVIFNTFFSNHAGFAFTMAGIVLSLAQTMQGILSIDMPKVLNGANWLSPLRFSPRALAPPSLRGVRFTCRPEQLTDAVCPITTGEQVLALYNLDDDENWNLVAIVVVAVAYRLLAWMLLVVMKGSWRRRLTRRRG